MLDHGAVTLMEYSMYQHLYKLDQRWSAGHVYVAKEIVET